jgi:uncharacterized protein
MNPVVHFEMPYEDQDRAAAFYETVFGWQVQKLGEAMGHYLLVTTAQSDSRADAPRGAINGGLFPKKPDWPMQHPSIVIAVGDIRESIGKVVKAGGQALGEPVEIPGVGHYVSFVDTEGNRNSMLQSLPR